MKKLLLNIIAIALLAGPLQTQAGFWGDAWDTAKEHVSTHSAKYLHGAAHLAALIGYNQYYTAPKACYKTLCNSRLGLISSAIFSGAGNDPYPIEIVDGSRTGTLLAESLTWEFPRELILLQILLLGRLPMLCSLITWLPAKYCPKITQLLPQTYQSSFLSLAYYAPHICALTSLWLNTNKNETIQLHRAGFFEEISEKTKEAASAQRFLVDIDPSKSLTPHACKKLTSLIKQEKEPENNTELLYEFRYIVSSYLQKESLHSQHYRNSWALTKYLTRPTPYGIIDVLGSVAKANSANLFKKFLHIMHRKLQDNHRRLSGFISDFPQILSVPKAEFTHQNNTAMVEWINGLESVRKNQNFSGLQSEIYHDLVCFADYNKKIASTLTLEEAKQFVKPTVFYQAATVAERLLPLLKLQPSTHFTPLQVIENYMQQSYRLAHLLHTNLFKNKEIPDELCNEIAQF